jgi:hypothetical protein
MVAKAHRWIHHQDLLRLYMFGNNEHVLYRNAKAEESTA